MIKPKFSSSSFIYPAPNKVLEKIQEEVQKKMKIIEKEENYKKADDFEKSNLILNNYAKVAYEEGFRYGLNKLKETESLNITIKRRKQNSYEYEDKNSKENLKLVRKRLSNKKMNKVLNKNSEELFVITVLIHSYFEFGYFDSTIDIKNITKAIYPHDLEKAESLNNIVEEVFKRGLNAQN